MTFTDANAIDTQANFSVDGTYVLRLTANDGEYAITDFVEITVAPIPPNVPPVVDAGPNRTATMPFSAALDGTASDDGLPNPPQTFTTLWTKGSGPGTVTFVNANAIDTQASFSIDGTYVLRLTGTTPRPQPSTR